MSLTLLTATGARPEAWAICEKLMYRQDYDGAVRWVIVDDGPNEQHITFSRNGWTLDVLRRQPYWRHGQNTQAANLTAGLEVIGSNERVVIIEDDDAYDRAYLSAVAAWLGFADLVGESHARYYNVKSGLGMQLSNAQHASLCSTAMKGPALEAFRGAVQRRQTYIDMDFWRNYHGHKSLTRSNLVVGIKGLPGRGGIGCGHRMDYGVQTNIRDWLGDDAELYGL